MSFATLDAFRRTAQTASGEISYLDAGTGPVALFVHGVGTNAYLWRGAIERLRHERRCIAIDLPLHGRSPARPDQDFSLPGLAAVLEGVCAALGLTRVDLIANDTGGAVAQVFAATHPERLSSLTLTNCDTQDNLPPEAFKPIVEQARAGLLAPAVLAQVANPDPTRENPLAAGYQDPSVLTDDLARAFAEPVLGTLERGRQFERMLVALDARDLLAVESRLRALTVPTLLVWGTDDVFFPMTWAHWLRDLIPGTVDLVEVPGGRLFFPDERPDDLVEPLRRFWSSIDAGRPAREHQPALG